MGSLGGSRFAAYHVARLGRAAGENKRDVRADAVLDVGFGAASASEQLARGELVAHGGSVVNDDWSGEGAGSQQADEGGVLHFEGGGFGLEKAVGGLWL